VGAPDAYAGELPVVYATLVPGAPQVTEAELLAFTAERVDEAVSRPRWVRVLETMPVTNVGKIYKPELRQRAACHTVQALVDGACATEAPGQTRPEVQPEGDNAVRVTVAPGAQADALATRLREVLAPLPLTVRVVNAPAAGSPQNA
jgi:fatty-acyl-CoA synthase